MPKWDARWVLRANIYTTKRIAQNMNRICVRLFVQPFLPACLFASPAAWNARALAHASILYILYYIISCYHYIAMRAKIFVSGTIEIKKQQQQRRQQQQQQCKPTWRCAIRNVTISFAHSLPHAYSFSFTPLRSVLCVECVRVCVCKHNYTAVHSILFYFLCVRFGCARLSTHLVLTL